MIIHERAINNRLGFFLKPAGHLLIALTFFMAGCGNDQETTDGENAGNKDQQSVAVDQCGVRVDETAWQVFADIARRHQSDQDVGREDYQVFADLPIMTQWKASMTDHLPSVRIVNWLDRTYNPDQKTGKYSSDRRQFSVSYAYTIDHLNDIDPLIKRFETEGHACNLMEKVNYWLSPDQVPDSLVVAFLPSKAEIRVLHQYLFVDTGVLRAGSMQQLENQLTGILFRARMQLHGDLPAACEGKDAVANSVRVMMNEGIIGIIEDQPGTIFDSSHPNLGDFNIVPEYVYEHGIKTINLFNNHLPSMLADEKVMQEKGRNLAKTLIASSSLNQGGFCMSATIAGNLGKDSLRATVGSPSAWLAAYQKAAKMNPVPAPEPYTVMDDMHMSMPPFDDSVYQGLQEILKQAFTAP